jgi:hypothetical protein
MLTILTQCFLSLQTIWNAGWLPWCTRKPSDEPAVPPSFNIMKREPQLGHPGPPQSAFSRAHNYVISESGKLTKSVR